MAKPILAPPVLTGKAADKLLRHLENAQPNPAKEAQNRKAIEFHASVPRRD